MTHRLVRLDYPDENSIKAVKTLLAEYENPEIAWRMAASHERNCQDRELGNLVFFQVDSDYPDTPRQRYFETGE